MAHLSVHADICRLCDYKYLRKKFDTGYMRKVDRYVTIKDEDRWLIVNSFYINNVLELEDRRVLHLLDIFSEPIVFYVFLERLQRVFRLDLSKPSRRIRMQTQQLLSALRTLIQYKFIVEESHDEYAELNRMRSALASRERYVDNVYVIPTLGCNFRCPQCFIYEGSPIKHANFMMSPALFDKLNRLIIDSVRRDIPANLVYNLYGGEPLLNRRLVEHVFRTVRRLESEGVYGKRRVALAMVTNGSMIDDHVASMLGNYNVRVGVSIDGVKSRHDARKKLPDGGGTFDLVMRGIHNLEKAGVPYGLSWTIGPDNIDWVAKDIGWIAKRVKTRGLYFNFQQDVEGSAFSDMDPSEYFKKMHEIYDKLEACGFQENRYMRYRRSGRRMSDLPPFPYNCSAVNGGQFVLRPDGTVGICSADIVHMNKSWQRKSCIVSYDRDPVFMEWIGRTPLNMKRCYTECEYFGLCSGGCAYFTERATGSAYEPSRIQCMFEQFMIERAIIEDYRNN